MAIPRDSVRPGLTRRPGSAAAPRLGIGRPWRFLTGAVAVAWLTGCSIDEHGLVRVRHYETPTATISTLSAVGANLSTHSQDFGLTLGWVERTYATPKPSAEGAATNFALTIDGVELEWHRAKPMTVTNAQNSGPQADPVLVAVRRGGLALDANPQRIGVMLGFQERAALIIPADGSTVVLLRLNLQTPEETTLMIGN